ncbi:hypothetical protein [Pseudomonas sp.]|uniref:hypothetical protein n=1 Tax=Pseudomonas sp. TaxID=306 RepID=UPI003F36EEC7
MNSKIAAFMLTGLLSIYSIYSLATEKNTEDATIPPSALPGLNQGGESNEEKADKKGEEASGSNSGAESEEMEKDAATSSGSGDEGTKRKP